ncbi:DNA-binding protein [Roseateles sp. P5_E11]
MKTLPPFLALELEIRVALPTKEAAFHLNRSEQTLRLWACKQCGPLLPVRINGRLAWPVAEIRRVMTGAA